MNIKQIKETAKYLLRSKCVIAKYIDEVEALYEMTPDELRQRNEEKFLQLFRLAFQKSPFYHRFYTEAGIGLEDIQCLDDIRRLPVLTKEMIKAHAEEIRIAPKWKLIANHTSGTTGSPLMVYEDWPSIWREQAYFYCYRRRCGYTYGEPIVSLRGNLEKKDLYLKVGVSNTLYLSSYNINPANAKIYYQQIVKHRPVAIEGYPSSLYSLALMLRDQGLQLHIPVAFTSSETLLDYQRSLIEKQLDTQIYDHYGTTERTIRLSEAINHQGYFEDPGYSINEYTEDGEITTSLINFSFPLIRYKGNDIIEMMEVTEENPQVIVKKVQGRKSTYLTGKDGTEYSGALLTRVFKDISTIENAQFIQERQGEVTLNYVPGKGFTNADEHKLLLAVEEQLGRTNFDFHFRAISRNEIQYSDSGKFQYIIQLQSKSGGNPRHSRP
jgi:phenylacetate-CoA ligase